MKRITKAEVQGLFDRYKNIFGLSNWQCKVFVLSEKELNKRFKETVLPVGDAGLEFDPMTEHADICISRKCSYRELDFSIKHEMGHLVFSDMDGLVESILHRFKAKKEDTVNWHLALDQTINKWVNIVSRTKNAD